MAEPIKNMLKVREDSEPLVLEQSERGGAFSFSAEQTISSWFPKDKNDEIKASDLRTGIEPWLTSLFQSEHLSLLIGSGLSNAVHFMATDNPCNSMSKPKLGTEYADNITARAKVVAEKSNRGDANIEDYIRVMNELLQGLEVLGHDLAEGNDKDKYDKLSGNLEKTIKEFADSISETENGIASAVEEKRKEAFDYLVNFLMSFASRTGTRERLNIFTTNYDRLIEAGSEIAGLHLLDRFVGSLAPIFRSSRLDIDMHYNPPGIRGEPRHLEGVHGTRNCRAQLTG
jgi:hypothetical protein